MIPPHSFAVGVYIKLKQDNYIRNLKAGGIFQVIRTIPINHLDVKSIDDGKIWPGFHCSWFIPLSPLDQLALINKES